MQVLYAGYGFPLSFYGNIGLGEAQRNIQKYGGWPEDHPNILDDAHLVKREEPEKSIEEKIADNISQIKALRSQLIRTYDNKHRQRIRDEIEEVKNEKVRNFKAKALIDEDESAFLLLH